MERPLRRQIGFTMMALVAAVVLVLMLADNVFLGRVYLYEKEESLEKVFLRLNRDIAKGKVIYGDRYALKLEKLCANENLGLLVMSPDGTLLLSSQNQSKIMVNQLYDIMLSGSDGGGEVKSTDDYSIRRGEDPQTNNEYLLLWGNLNDGNIILIRTSIESIRDASRISNRFLILAGVVTMLLAIVASEFISRKLTRSIRQLSEENAHLTKDILTSRENDRMRKEFLSNVSHELKTPIALIQGYAEGLLDGVEGEDAAFYQEVIIDEAKKMNTLVQKLLSLNRLEYGSGNVEYEKVDLGEIIQGVINANSISAKEKDIEIRYEEGDSPRDVWADPLLAEQVITNYLTNAIHYCTGQPPSITVRLKGEEDILKLSVFNTGEAISEEKLPHIWEKFYKADPARTREYGGSGIGLSIVRAIADEMEGDCGVINYDNGVEFWFNFHFFVEELRQ